MTVPTTSADHLEVSYWDAPRIKAQSKDAEGLQQTKRLDLTPGTKQYRNMYPCSVRWLREGGHACGP